MERNYKSIFVARSFRDFSSRSIFLVSFPPPQKLSTFLQARFLISVRPELDLYYLRRDNSLFVPLAPVTFEEMHIFNFKGKISEEKG